jgi:predicted acetyltransferase
MTAPAVRLAPAALADKPALWEMMARYLVEHARKVDPASVQGPPEYAYFDSYWIEPERRPYWIEADGARAGFVLVNAWSPSGLGTERSIAEFCVDPPWRRRGFGLAAALAAFRAHPGQWELRVYRLNGEGMAFWPRAIQAAGATRWQVIEREDVVIHRFVVTP